MKKLFGDLKMTWLGVVIFAIAAGVYTGAVMLIPALNDSSFQDIGISYECWVVFAVIIVVNCKNSLGAMLKCFVFFLISQPLVYAVEVVFGSLDLELAKTYYFSIWLPMTILTLPGGFIAYFCKKQNALGAVILGLGNTILMLIGAAYTVTTVKSFPQHLLSAVFSFVMIFVLTFCIQKEKKNRLVSILLPVLLTAATLVVLKATGRHLI